MTHHATRTLQELGYRLTPQRTLVWDVLRAGGSHMSAEEVCDHVHARFPNVNISTVYRTLDLLVRLGLVKETLLAPGRRTFEVEEESAHHHLVCRECGAVEHLHDEDLGGLPATLHDDLGFRTAEVTVFGMCSACAGAARAATAPGADPGPSSHETSPPAGPAPDDPGPGRATAED